MALHVEFMTAIRIYGDAAKAQPKGGLVVEDLVLSSLNTESSGRVQLAASAADVVFNLQGTSGKLVLLQCDKEFSFKLNGGSAISCMPRAGGSGEASIPACAMLMTNAITSLTLSNPSTTEAVQVDVAVCG